jgi:catechol 2,3-dioxygenase-like lactoylglutathione lyase family enzyme
MTDSQIQISQVATVVVPVADQDRALAFYADVLGLEKTSDFTYDSGERWLEVCPRGSSTSLSLVTARPERPAGIETGIALISADVLADLARLHARGVEADRAPLAPGEVVWWSGAPLAGYPTQFRVYDPDGNSLLIVAKP